jgi:quercetin dioxygenase-like cupin family protein
LTGADTEEHIAALEVSLAPEIGVPRHTDMRDDESYYVIAGELEVGVGHQKFVLKRPMLLWPRETSLTS